MTRAEKLIQKINESGAHKIECPKIEGSATTYQVIVDEKVVIPSAVKPRMEGFVEGMASALSLSI